MKSEVETYRLARVDAYVKIEGDLTKKSLVLAMRDMCQRFLDDPEGCKKRLEEVKKEVSGIQARARRSVQLGGIGYMRAEIAGEYVDVRIDFGDGDFRVAT